jgi:hypothetical protein
MAIVVIVDPCPDPSGYARLHRLQRDHTDI